MKTTALAVAIGMVFISFNLSAQTINGGFMPMMGGKATPPSKKASPIFTGPDLPEPPRQHARWTVAQTDLPTNYVSATRVLFEQGLADPRGCEYRAIEIGTGNVWQGDGGVVATHGWVLPGSASQKFAVAWNGLVYPVVSAGTNADLEADVASLEANGHAGWYSAISEAMSVSQSSLLGLKGCLLLRLGRVDLATGLWLAQEGQGRSFNNEMVRRFSRTNDLTPTNGIKLAEADPYLGWATDWAWAMFDRTICAHERGDEKLALLTARVLAAAQPQIEAECAKRGFKPQPYFDNFDNSHHGQTQPYLIFLGQLPELLADLERRDKEGIHVSIMSTGEYTNITDQTERIAALIHDLDLVGARQWSQPGGVNLAEDGVVTALIQEGDAAVEPLLNCLEHDQRLTRSVSFGRDFSRGRTVLSVKNAANDALLSILQAGFAGGAPEMRAYWSKYKNLKLEDRWYAILNDDSARARWQEAAANIVQPENMTSYPGGFSVVRRVPTNAVTRLRGESLRAKANPSVSELLAQHALEVPTNDISSYDLGVCCQYADDLGRWDPAAALPVLKTMSKRASTVMKYSGQQLGNFLTRFALARAQAGDPQAFDDYADWIVTTPPEQMGNSVSDNLSPLKEFPTNPILEAAAEKMFADSNSPWGSLPWKENFGNNVVHPELVAVPAYRELLRRELEKTNAYATISWQGTGYLSYSISNYQSGGFSYSFPKELQPTNGAAVDIRWCDWIALTLANQKQVLFFNPFAPVAERDKTIAGAKEELLKK